MSNVKRATVRCLVYQMAKMVAIPPKVSTTLATQNALLDFMYRMTRKGIKQNIWK